MAGAFRVILLCMAALAASCSAPPASRTAGNGPLIVISIDGFRWDYLQRYAPPTLSRLAAEGVHATRLSPSFPSKTFPNHHTIATGLRPEHHGLVGNWFHDPATNENFTMDRLESKWWDGGEPIWITAEKQGMPSACYFWPGAEAVIRGRQPSFGVKWNKAATAADRVDGVLRWLEQPPARRPRLVMMYFEMVDNAGHDFGPLAPETGAAVLAADAAVQRLLDGLDRLGLRDRTNLVLVSDHGMSEVGPDRVVFVDDLVDLSQVTVEAIGPYAGVRPRPGVDAAALVASMRVRAPAQVKIFRREEMPTRLHYDSGDRIPPILLLADDHWCIEQKTGWPALKAKYHHGNHGWDPATSNMGALFIAHGPAFRRSVTLADADNVDIYNLLCRVLGLRPAPNDGGERLVRAVLR